MINRRHFLHWLGQAAFLSIIPIPAWYGRTPPHEESFGVILPEFMSGLIGDRDLDYLNSTIPMLLQDHAEYFPILEKPPQIVVVNTFTDTLVHYGNTLLVPEILGDEALTLQQVQHLLVTTRFGSVATPHRGMNLDQFGKVIYLKQHPDTGYRTPEHLLLEELLHIQQDITIMREIIQRENLDPSTCLHAQLKGISELGAHYYIEIMRGEPDYVFLMDDQTLCENAAECVHILAERLQTNDQTMVQALNYDTATYNQLDQIAVESYNRHIWEMVTTWRHSRDAEGNSTGIAPAFQPYPSLSSSSS